MVGSFQVKAQDNTVKFNLFSIIVRTGSFFYERKINDNSSAQLGFFYTGATVSDVKFRGFGITPEYRYYPSGNAMNGFYVAPYLRYQNLKIEQTADDKATLSSFGGGLLVGRQWIFNEKIALDIFAGPNYNAGNVKVTSGSVDEVAGGFDGFGVRLGLALGIGF
ncbi:MAG: DUF3575 domain-containing protein [Verrucomicrobia bacterium]|nr:DUF3575 domain-containing protein [Cytophagales bacterium]